MTPKDISPGSDTKVWWRCTLGHEWQAAVSSRTANGHGCPICAGKVVLPGFNDLATHSPDIATQWHPTLNGALTPKDVTTCSNRKAWWICAQGHSFYTTVEARVRSGGGCPYCTGRKVLAGFNDLTTTHPEVAKQWHPTLNGELTPEMVSPGSHKRIWWICDEGHVWQARVDSRTDARKCGCPVCSGRMKEPQADINQP